MTVTDGPRRVRGMSNTSLVNGFLAYAERRYEPMTHYTYSRAMVGLLAWSKEEGLSLLQASTGDLDRFCDLPLSVGRRKGEPPSPTTRKRRIMELRSLYKWACQVERAVKDDPAQGLLVPRIDNERPNPVPADVWCRLWASDLSDVDRVALGLCFFVGLRRQEVLRMRVPSVDVPARTLRNFWRKGGKIVPSLAFGTAYDVFTAKMPEAVGDPRLFPIALKRVTKEREGSGLLLDYRENMDYRRLSGHRRATPMDLINPETFNKRLYQLQHDARIPETEWVTPHQLRHGFVTYLCRMLGEQHIVKVSRMAGHADVRVTMRYLLVGSDDDPLAGILDEDDGEGGMTVVRRW